MAIFGVTSDQGGGPNGRNTQIGDMPTMTNAILNRTIEIVRGSLGSALEDIVIDRFAVGLFFTGVKLSTGYAGACATPVKEIPDAVCCPRSAMAMPFPGKLKGRRANGLLDEAVE